jgi:hypothetical protein
MLEGFHERPRIKNKEKAYRGMIKYEYISSAFHWRNCLKPRKQ